MGLFSSKSKSSSKSTTTYTDNSKKINVDLSKGDSVAGGAGENQTIVAGGNVTYNGMSDSLANKIFGVMSDTFNASLNWVADAIKGTNDQQAAILEQQQNSQEKMTQALQTAYNSEQATISSFKTYALYAMFAFIAWAYFGRKK